MITPKRKLFFIIFIFTPILLLYSQRGTNKSYTHNYLEYPYVALDSMATVGIKMYSNTINFVDADLKRKRARKALEFYVANENYLTYRDVKIDNKNPDVLVEIAFSEVSIIKTEIKTHEIACKRVGTRLNSIENIKKNLKKCPAPYYQISYKLPYIVKISSSDKNTLFIKKNEGRGTTSFGYDKTGLTGFLKLEDLKQAYTNSGEKKIIRDSYLENTSKSINLINSKLFFKQVEDNFKFGSAKGKNFDYSKLNSVLEDVLRAFKNNSGILETLNKSNRIWEEELKKKDLGNKKARINRSIATTLYGNLTLSNIYLNRFDKAEPYSEQYLMLANKSFNGNLQERAKKIYYLVKERKKRYSSALKKENVLKNNLVVPPSIITVLNASKNENKFIEPIDNFSQFNSDYNKFKVKEIKETASDITKRAAKRSPVDKYRSQIQRTAMQGNFLFLNSWYANDIKGKSLPKEICELTELNDLRVYNLELVSIPTEIGNLVNLEKLDLSGNNLSVIPKEIGNLKKLKILDLSKNNLDELPIEITQLPKLKKIVLKKNNFSKDYIEKFKRLLPKKCKIKY